MNGVCEKYSKSGLGDVAGVEKSLRIFELVREEKERAEREAGEACFEGEGWEDAREHAEGEGEVKVQDKAFGDCGGEKEPVEEPFNKGKYLAISTSAPSAENGIIPKKSSFLARIFNTFTPTVKSYELERKPNDKSDTSEGWEGEDDPDW